MEGVFDEDSLHVNTYFTGQVQTGTAAGLWPSADSPLYLLALIHAVLHNMFYLEFYNLDSSGFVFILDSSNTKMLPLSRLNFYEFYQGFQSKMFWNVNKSCWASQLITSHYSVEIFENWESLVVPGSTDPFRRMLPLVLIAAVCLSPDAISG